MFRREHDQSHLAQEQYAPSDSVVHTKLIFRNSDERGFANAGPRFFVESRPVGLSCSCHHASMNSPQFFIILRDFQFDIGPPIDYR